VAAVRRSAHPAGAVPGADVPRRARPTAAAAWQPPTTEELVREHVVPALVAAGALTGDEAVRVTAPVIGRERDGRSQQPSPGTALVTPGRVRVAPPAVEVAPPAAALSPPEVHVHIDRVEVLRAAAPTPPPQPAPPRRQTPRVDHAAYLERRRADRR
jgi:hypothetical protein